MQFESGRPAVQKLVGASKLSRIPPRGSACEKSGNTTHAVGGLFRYSLHRGAPGSQFFLFFLPSRREGRK